MEKKEQKATRKGEEKTVAQRPLKQLEEEMVQTESEEEPLSEVCVEVRGPFRYALRGMVLNSGEIEVVALIKGIRQMKRLALMLDYLKRFVQSGSLSRMMAIDYQNTAQFDAVRRTFPEEYGNSNVPAFFDGQDLRGISLEMPVDYR